MQVQLQLSKQFYRARFGDEQTLVGSINDLGGLAERLKKAGIAPGKIRDLYIAIVQPHFLLVPNAYAHELFQRSFLEKALGAEQSKGREFHRQEIEKEQAKLLFWVDSAWKDALSFQFPMANQHYRHQVGQMILENSNFLKTQWHCYLADGWAYILLRQAGKLQICNAYPYENALGLAYYLHAIQQSFEYPWHQQHLHFYGPDAQSEALMSPLLELNIPIQIHEIA